MIIECQGWKLSVRKDETTEWYGKQKKYSVIDWSKFQEKYQETANFLNQIYIDMEKPFDYQIVSNNDDGTKEYELVYIFLGTAEDGEYEIDFGCINICLENLIDASGKHVTKLYLYNVVL